MPLLALNKIRLDGGTQSREQLSDDAIAEYAAKMADGEEFPRVVVFYDGTDHWLADGFHRVKARAAAGKSEVDADVRQGTRRDAILHSVGANAAHGLRRTNEDKRRAVLTLLNDEQWAKWSDREIAAKTGTSNRFVSNLRNEAVTVNGSQSDGRTYTTRHGTTAVMNTANIGRKPAPSPLGDDFDNLAPTEKAARLDSIDPLLAKYEANKAREEEQDDGDDDDGGESVPVLERTNVRHTVAARAPVAPPRWAAYPDIAKCITELDAMCARPAYQLSLIDLKRITDSLKSALQETL